jgi:hypothetical protein
MRDGFVCPLVHLGLYNFSQEMVMKIPPIVQGKLHEIASAIANLLHGGRISRSPSFPRFLLFCRFRLFRDLRSSRPLLLVFVKL